MEPVAVASTATTIAFDATGIVVAVVEATGGVAAAAVGAAVVASKLLCRGR